MGNYSDIQDRLSSLVDSLTAGPATLNAALTRETINVNIAADAAAGTAKNAVLFKAPAACRIVAARYIPGAVVTQDAANYAILDLNKEDGAAGGLTSLDSYSTQTAGNGTIAARVGFAWAMVISDTLAVNEVLVLEITKAGTGVALSEAVVQLTVEYA